MTIFLIQWMERRNYVEPCTRVFTNLHDAQAFALDLLQDLDVTDDEIAAAGYDDGYLWQKSYWMICTSFCTPPKRTEHWFISFETINLPTE